MYGDASAVHRHAQFYVFTLSVLKWKMPCSGAQITTAYPEQTVQRMAFVQRQDANY
jgi:hypothetical protein